MKNKSPFMALAAILFFLIVYAPPDAYGAGQVDVILDRGVSRETEAQTRMAIDATTDFFKKTYGLDLERKLEIFVVPDEKGHINALKQRYSMPEPQATHATKTTGGIASKGVIVINAANYRSNQTYFSCVCHELVHYFQFQESHDRISVRWLIEGVAEVLAAQIMAAASVKGAVDPQKKWLEILKKAGKTPRLEDLNAYSNWQTSIKTHGQTVAYATSAVAVLNLVQSKGNKPLFNYFRALSNAEPEDAFYQAFGVKLSDFEKDFRPF